MGGLRTKEMSFMHRDVSALVHHGPSLIKPKRNFEAQRLSAFDPFNSRAPGAPCTMSLPFVWLTIYRDHAYLGKENHRG